MITDAITSELPYLRRFARVLSGSQSSGDAYVGSTLEALLADPQSFESQLAPRVALYKVFLRVWNTIKLNTVTEPLTEDDMPATREAASADRRLEAITPLPRQAFLLLAVEAFSPEEAAQVLDVSCEKVTALIGEASSEIAEQIASSVLIIEDEPLIAMDLEQLVESIGHTVIDIARTHDEAIEAIASRKPGLVLADIQLADGSSGLNAVNQILERISVPVIFITAYPERLLTGQRPEPAFLITKPFQPDTVMAVISQALFFEQAATPKSRNAA